MSNLFDPFKEPFTKFPNPYCAAKKGKLTGAIYKLLVGTIQTMGLLDCLFLLPLAIKMLSRLAGSNHNKLIEAGLNLVSVIFFCIYSIITIPLSILLLPICWLANHYFLSKLKKMENELETMEVLPMEQLMGAPLTSNEDMMFRIERFPLAKQREIEKYCVAKRFTIPQETLYQNFYRYSPEGKPSIVTLKNCCGSDFNNFMARRIYLTDKNNVETGDIVFGLYKIGDGDPKLGQRDLVPTCFIVPCKENAQFFSLIRLMDTFLLENVDKNREPQDAQRLNDSLTRVNPFLKMAQNRARQMFTALGIYQYTPNCALRNSVLDLMPQIMDLADFGALEIQPLQLSSFVRSWSPSLFTEAVPATDGVFQSELSKCATNG